MLEAYLLHIKAFVLAGFPTTTTWKETRIEKILIIVNDIKSPPKTTIYIGPYWKNL